MEYFFTEEQKDIQQLARSIAENEVRPAAAELDEKEEFPRRILEHLSKAGLLGVYVPEEYGGFGGGVTELCIVTEELSKACVGVSTSYAANALGALPILISGSEEQKKRFIPPIAAGDHLTAFCLTEPEAGSDATAVKTAAVRDGDEWVLNGTKQWITNGGEADVYTVIAVTDKNKGARGISAFILEAGSPGLSFGKKEKKLGIRCSATREVIFDDCRVPAENLLGRLGTGLMTTVRTLDRARVGVGAQAVGLGQAALDHAINYSRQRRQFDQPIAAFQGVQHILADMATQLEAARALVYCTARMIDAGSRSFAKEAAMSKLFASDMAMRVAVDAVQIYGGYGYMREYPVEKLMRDAKILQIYEGTNQIQRNTIALALIKEAAKHEE
jgi:alkylation response protein AidB-like acyl-CoA dehydrogenase